ncbi:sensor histidine kinase [Microbacterium sp. NPDC089695]|uniref:sensor histidine kinase n=1 Tax=Microbacterium sp. NPDC089695 TaxID=3364198 RepID=UPI0037F3036D
MTIDRGITATGRSIPRMHRIVMGSAILAIAPLSVIGVFLTTTSWWEALFIALTLAFTTTLLKEWSLDGYAPKAVFLMLFTGATFVYGAFMAHSPISFMPFALVGALLVMRVRTHRVAAALLFALGVAALGTVSLAANPITATLVIRFIVIPAVGTLYIVAVVFVGELAWKLVRAAERATDVESALAVSEERARFAGDLHDIQGQSLHVIKLKAALAQRLLHDDPSRASAELAEIRRLVDDTVTTTRDLAAARYEIDLAAELENTRALGEASGIRVVVRQELDRATRPHPLLAHTLREATTNLLRHAEPAVVTITARTDAVEVSNDGVHAHGEFHPRGLTRLRRRIEDAGGELHIDRDGDVFTVRARLAPADAVASHSADEEGR